MNPNASAVHESALVSLLDDDALLATAWLHALREVADVESREDAAVVTTVSEVDASS